MGVLDVVYNVSRGGPAAESTVACRCSPSVARRPCPSYVCAPHGCALPVCGSLLSIQAHGRGCMHGCTHARTQMRAHVATQHHYAWAHAHAHANAHESARPQTHAHMHARARCSHARRRSSSAAPRTCPSCWWAPTSPTRCVRVRVRVCAQQHAALLPCGWGSNGVPPRHAPTSGARLRCVCAHVTSRPEAWPGVSTLAGPYHVA